MSARLMGMSIDNMGNVEEPETTPVLITIPRSTPHLDITRVVPVLGEIEDLDLLLPEEVQFLVRTQNLDTEYEGEVLLALGYAECNPKRLPITPDEWLIRESAIRTICKENQ